MISVDCDFQTFGILLKFQRPLVTEHFHLLDRPPGHEDGVKRIRAGNAKRLE